VVPFPGWLSLEDLWGSGPRQAELLRRLLPGPELSEEVAYASDWWHAFAEAWPWRRAAPLPQGWLHWDYHGRNMVFQGDRMAGLFDFDWSGPGFYVIDIGRGLFNFSRPFRGARTMREDFARAYLYGYEEIRPLTRLEWQALPTAAAFGWAPDAIFYESRLDAGEGLAERLRRDVSINRAIESETRRLASAFGWGE
jgi:Ser/Thr protein kinase RdoA (MazF antagonist)